MISERYSDEGCRTEMSQKPINQCGGESKASKAQAVAAL